MMETTEYELYIQFIEDVLYNLTTTSDYMTVLDSLDIPHKGNRVKGGCHDDLDKLPQAGYHVKFDEYKRLFYCHSICQCGYNLLTFVEKVFNVRGEDKSRNDCLKYICNVLDIPFNFKTNDTKPKTDYNWRKELSKYLPKQDRIEELTVYDDEILNRLESLYHQSFIDDNISISTMEKYRLKYYRYAQQIVIPVYDDEGNFVGAHCRNLRPELIELGLKYIPLKTLNGKEYKFLTSQVLYGLNTNKDNIIKTKSIILGEAPKFVMQMEEILDINISVGMFGMTLKKSQRNLILKYEVNTVYIALDKQYKTMYYGDIKTKEFEDYEKKVYKIYDELKNFVPNIYVICDDGEILNYKDSPSDHKKKIWDKLFEKKEKL